MAGIIAGILLVPGWGVLLVLSWPLVFRYWQWCVGAAVLVLAAGLSWFLWKRKGCGKKNLAGDNVGAD
jgi:hypothetical protein